MTTETYEIEADDLGAVPSPTHVAFSIPADDVTLLMFQLGGIAGAYYEDGQLFLPVDIADSISDIIEGLPAIVLADKKSSAITALTHACMAAIVGGYRSNALGDEHTYPSKITDQINMMGSVTASLLPDRPADWVTPFWCMDEAGTWGFRAHSAEQIQLAGSDGKAHVVFCQSHLDSLTAQVNAAHGADDVAAVVWA